MNEEFNVDGKGAKAVIDPELDRENWPIIMIDNEDGKPNYEFVAAHGTLRNGDAFSRECQIMRGVEVPVPPSIVNVLNLAVSAHYKHVKDPETGNNKLVRSDRSSVPWRIVKPGKYFS